MTRIRQQLKWPQSPDSELQDVSSKVTSLSWLPPHHTQFSLFLRVYDFSDSWGSAGLGLGALFTSANRHGHGPEVHLYADVPQFISF